ncbi:hypothetical protein RJ639_004912 [Escallonia herrerae]|uniref:NAC domain-containing protein n=1 Tax=Escallonia herrerae TaxID=1293975 RepID=A0AA88W510_9ASTE|nr:hypothetical protein RJ639_004912 [Escallonia herrerae]
MGEPKDPGQTPPFSLPPGCRFYPSDQELLCYYLTHKNANDRRFDFNVISEIDIYGYDPFNLPDTACFRFGRGGRKRHWYCYAAAARVLRAGGGRRWRRAGGGFWRRGRVRDVVGGGGVGGRVVVGTRRAFEFYLGSSVKSAVRTDWVMHEYALSDRDMAFVLCRVLVKSRRGNYSSEHGSCGEESVATVRHIGVQHDGSIRSVIDDTKVHDDNSVDKKKEKFEMGVASGLDNRIIAESVNLQTRSSDQSFALDAEQLMAILEEDFIELDDLLCPLPGID